MALHFTRRQAVRTGVAASLATLLPRGVFSNNRIRVALPAMSVVTVTLQVG